MYKINVNETVADIEFLENRVKQYMSRGIRVGDIKPIYEHYYNLYNTIKAEIQQEYGIDNPNSPKQIVRYLQETAGKIPKGSKNDIIEVCYDDKKDKWTTDGEAMGSLRNLGYSIGADIIDYRTAKKYADSVKSLIDSADNNGLIHPVVSLAKTNRINYSKPGLMSIPKKLLWTLIQSYNDGNSLYSVDIKNQEPSILINLLGDKELIEALKSTDGLYEALFKKVYSPTVTMNMLNETFEAGKLYDAKELKNSIFVEPSKYVPKPVGCGSVYYNGEKVTLIEQLCQGYSKNVEIIYPETVLIETELNNVYRVPVIWRKDFKAKRSADFEIIGDIQGLDIDINRAERNEFKVAWNAMTYGCTIFGVRHHCKLINGDIVYRYFNSIEGFKQYKKMIDGFIKNGSEGITTIFKNKVYATGATGSALKRSMLDLPIQGTGADILSCLIKHFEEETEKLGLSDKLFIYYTRHDELIIEVDKDWLSENRDNVENVLRDILEHQIILNGKEWEPFKVEVKEVVSGIANIDDDDE